MDEELGAGGHLDAVMAQASQLADEVVAKKEEEKEEAKAAAEKEAKQAKI